MAVVALNKFRTIRVPVTTDTVGIYTCPIGVASIVILCQVTNVFSGAALSAYTVSAFHSRPTESTINFAFANEFLVAPNDGANLVSDGRLALETSDSIQVTANENGVLEIILSVLETAKQ